MFKFFKKYLPKADSSLAEKVYKCPECGFLYKEKEWAKKCENWCREYKSCNLEITQHAIKESK